MPELLDKVSVYTDGGARGNPGPSAIGVLVYSQTGNLLADLREFIGNSTNNQAEYKALTRGLEIASRYTRKKVVCHSDSELMINQVKGKFMTRNPGLMRALEKVKIAERSFQNIEYVHVPRTNPRIKLADILVNRALDEKKTEDDEYI